MTRFRLNHSALVLALAALLAVAGATGARAQTGVWRQINLPGAGSRAVAAGDSGSVLAVSTGGLFQYDGLRVRQIPIFASGVDSIDGTAVLRARNGDVWFGSSNQGLFRRRMDGTVNHYTRASGIGNASDDWINDLAETPDGQVWAATTFGGLSRFDGSTWATITTDQGLPSMNVSSLAVDPRDGSIWAGTRGFNVGLVHIVGTTVVAVYRGFTLTPSTNVQSVLVTSRGDVWVGHDSGLARLKGSTFEEFGTGTANAVVALSDGGHGEIWFGLGNRGVGVWDIDRVRILPSGPPGNAVRELYRDPAGVLWVATTGGLARFEGAAWRSYVGDDGLPPFVAALSAVRDLSSAARGDSIDDQGISWLGTEQQPVSEFQTLKLTRRANGRMRRIGTADGLPAGVVSALARADSGAIWCGTSAGLNGGVARVRADGSVAWIRDAAGGLPSTYVLDVADAGSGEVWAATAQGAFRVGSQGIRALRVGPGGLPAAPIVGVALDAQGRVWFASGGNPFSNDPRPPAGAVRFDPADSTFLSVGAAQGLPTNDLNGVTVGINGDVWFASDAGVIRYRNGAVRTFTVNDGLPINSVLRVSAAPDGRIWAATSQGIATFDGVAWSAFSVADGLIGALATHIFADSLGVIVSCRQDGVSLFHPDRTPPRVEITSGPPAATGASRVQFGVRGGDLDSDASRVRISSELVGRAATPFTEDVDAVALDLPDGHYVFRVRGKDRALNETAEPFEWQFTVDATPPRPVVQQPAFNEIVKDTVRVLGRIGDPRFDHYVVELRAEGTVAWDTLLVSDTAPPAGASLFDWLSRDVDDGAWELRVGVEDSLGLIGYSQVSVIVDNFAPSATVTSPTLVDRVTGGSVFTTGGEVELYLPPNALAEDQIVRIDPLAVDPPAALAPTVRVLSAWILRPIDLVLAKPGTLSIRIPAPGEPGAGAPALAPPGIARLVITGADTTLVPVGGAVSADGTRTTTSIGTFGTYVLASGLQFAAAGQGVSALDCQPRVLSPRGGGFDVRTAISFELGQPGAGAVKVYDRAGRLVKEVVESQVFTAGSNVVYWDGTDGDGAVVPSGLYTVAVRFDGKTAVRTVAVANR